MNFLSVYVGLPQRPPYTQEEIDKWNAGKIRLKLKCVKCKKDCEIDYHLDYPLGVLALYQCYDCSNGELVTIENKY